MFKGLKGSFWGLRVEFEGEGLKDRFKCEGVL